MSARETAIRHEEFRATRHFAALDGLRAVAVFLVFSEHFGGPGWTRFSGWLGVHAFFVLSGFLITTLLLRERDATGRISLKAFYIRRATRLLPLYLLVVAAASTVAWFAQDESWAQMKAALPYYLSLLNELAALAPLHMTWTLGVEWKYYLVWPALLVVFGATPRSGLATVAIGVAGLAAIGLGGLHWNLLLPQNYIGMLLGTALAIVMHSRRGFEWVRGLMGPALAIALVLALLVWQRRFPLAADRLGAAGAMAVYSLLVTLLIPALLAPRTWVARVLAAKWLVFIGHRSYAMYLVQYLCANAVIALLPGLVVGTPLLLLSFAVALVVSDWLHRGVEKPLTGWGHRLAQAARMQPRPTGAAMRPDTGHSPLSPR